MNGTVVVFGVTGNIGWGVGKVALASGAGVVAPVRREDQVAQVTADLPGADVVVADIGDPDGALAIGDAVAARGPLGHVVASLGPWWMKGRLAEQDPHEWPDARRGLLDGHVHAATALLPLLEAGGVPGASYTLITGQGSHSLDPRLSLLTVATGGVLAMSRSLREEYADGPVRVNELLIRARVEREGRPRVVPAQDFGQAVWQVVSSDVRSAVIPFRALADFAPVAEGDA